jgi:anti-sigma regulatory factor (Ser/Thr protein kinase)
MRIAVNDSSAAYEARRNAAELASQLQLDESTMGRLSILVSEATTNLLKHAGGGDLFVHPLNGASCQGIEILAVDHGPGITDLSRSLQDGYSTSGTLGGGLGAMNRLSQVFDIDTRAGKGTVLVSRVWPETAPVPPAPGLEVAGLSVAKPNETVCGDAWDHRKVREGTLILVADGLGHGPEAALAADRAVQIFRETRLTSPALIVADVHAALRHTRGAAVAVILLDRGHGRITWSGVGNITGVISSPVKRQHLVSQNGITGHQAPRITEIAHPWSVGSLLVLTSDGLMNRWDLDAYPGLALRHPGIIAGTLFRDFARGTDDATVVVAREDGV